MIWMVIPRGASRCSRAKRKKLEYKKGCHKLRGISEVGWNQHIQMKCGEEVGSEVNKPTGCRSASVVDHKVEKSTDGERIFLPKRREKWAGGEKNLPVIFQKL